MERRIRERKEKKSINIEMCKPSQIWGRLWKKGLKPDFIATVRTVMEEEGMKPFVTMVSPLGGAREAMPEQEKGVEPGVEGKRYCAMHAFRVMVWEVMMR